MYVPRVRSRFEVPRALLTGLAAVCAIVTAVLVAALFTRSTSDAPAFSAASLPISTEPGAVVYSASANGKDEIFVRNVEGEEAPRLVASFSYVYDLHLRGTTSPAGEQLAVLHVDGGAGPAARLSLIDLATGERRDVEGGFDYLSRIAWSPAADRLALVQRLEGGDPSRGFALLEVDAAKLSVARLHTFETALEVAPLGYRPDGALLVAVVDDGGSTVWAYSEGEATAGPRFSSGLTSDWSLSPDGDRLAFVEHLGVAQRNRGGRVLTIATGRITAAGSAGEHTGAVWRPGSPVPDFGGPGGTVVLSDPEPGSYLVPMSWTPDGRYLVAAVFQPAVDGEEPRSIVEIMSPGRRMHLSPVDGARFLGLAAVD